MVFLIRDRERTGYAFPPKFRFEKAKPKKRIESTHSFIF